MGADFRVHKTRSRQYTSFSNWDTYRTQIQLLAMLTPDVASDVVLSHRAFAEQSGGAYPRWVLANIETGVMQGDPTPILIANAWAFGAQDYDPYPLFRIMRVNAEVPGATSQGVEERPGLRQYLEKGYWNASEQARIHLRGLRHRPVRAARRRRRVRLVALFRLRPLVAQPLQPRDRMVAVAQRRRLLEIARRGLARIDLQELLLDGSLRPGRSDRDDRRQGRGRKAPRRVLSCASTPATATNGSPRATSRASTFRGSTTGWAVRTRPRRSSTARSTSSIRVRSTVFRATTTWGRWAHGTSSPARASTR